MIYRPHPAKALFACDFVNFSMKRWIRLPHQVFLKWIVTPVDIREPTPLPMCLADDLKPGYHWADLIH